MSTKPKSLAAMGIALTAILGIALGVQAGAQDAANRARSPRGGILTTAEGHQFEVFFYPTGVRLFVLDATGNRSDASGLTGNATFYHPNDPDTPWFSRPLHPDLAGADHLPASLVASVGLAGAPRNGVVVDFDVMGLDSKTSSTAEFRVPLDFVAATATRPAARTVARSVTPTPADNPLVRVQPGYGAAAPATVAQPALVPFTYAPGSYVGAIAGGATYGGNFIESHRDWSTGRINYPLSKPWMRGKY